MTTTYDPTTRRFEADMTVSVLDTFGVENTDFDTPSQMAMWVLQHQRGIEPFRMRTEMRRRVSFELRPQPPRFNPHQQHPIP